MKGDVAQILVDAGTEVERFEIQATQAGSLVEVANVRGTVEVAEVTRSGTPIRTARFMETRVVAAIVEHPAHDRQE